MHCPLCPETILDTLGYDEVAKVGLGAPGGSTAAHLPAAQRFWREYLLGFGDKRNHFPHALEVFLAESESLDSGKRHVVRRWASRQYLDFRLQAGWSDWACVFSRVVGEYPRYPLL